MRLKYILLFIALSLLAFSCEKEIKPQVLLVGVYHNFPDDQQCNWRATYERVLRFSPDQISVEYDQLGDTISLKKYLGDNYLQVWDSVMVRWVGKMINPMDSVSRYHQLTANTESPKNRLNLWKYYHLNADIGNRNFQTYLIHSDWERYASLMDTSKVWESDFYKIHTSTVNRRRNGEFFNLIFPLAKELKIPYLYPTDYKGTYEVQSKAFESLAKSLENTKEWDEWMAAFKEFTDDLDQKAADCKGLDYTNTEPWLAKSDHLQAHFLADLKNPNFDAYTAIWYKRNREIANRIQAAIRKSGAKRMAVFYGQMHVYPIRRYLEELGIRVIILEELQ